MAADQPMKSPVNRRPVPLAEVIRAFWRRVEQRLVKVNRIDPIVARRGVAVYRKRVGNVALNGGDAETAKAIASAVRSGGFIKIRRKANGEMIQKKMAV